MKDSMRKGAASRASSAAERDSVQATQKDSNNFTGGSTKGVENTVREAGTVSDAKRISNGKGGDVEPAGHGAAATTSGDAATPKEGDVEMREANVCNTNGGSDHASVHVDNAHDQRPPDSGGGGVAGSNGSHKSGSDGDEAETGTKNAPPRSPNGNAPVAAEAAARPGTVPEKKDTSSTPSSDGLSAGEGAGARSGGGAGHADEPVAGVSKADSPDGSKVTAAAAKPEEDTCQTFFKPFKLKSCVDADKWVPVSGRVPHKSAVLEHDGNGPTTQGAAGENSANPPLASPESTPAALERKRDNEPHVANEYPMPEYGYSSRESIWFQGLKSKRRKLSCPDPRFVPGKNLTDFMDTDDKANLEISFHMNLYCDGFSFDTVPSLPTNATGPAYPYDRTVFPLLRAIDGGWLPGSIMSSLPCKFKEGSIVIEVRDFRHTSSRASSASAKSSNQANPIVHRVLLRSSTESRIASIEDASNGKWSDDLRLSVEALLLQATKPVVYLDPEPEVAAAAATIQVQRYCMKIGNPLRRVVAPQPPQAINVKLPQGSRGAQAQADGKGKSGVGVRVDAPHAQHVANAQMAGLAKVKGKGRAKDGVGSFPGSREYQDMGAAYQLKGTAHDKIERFTDKSLQKILSLERAVRESRAIPAVPQPVSVPNTHAISTPSEIAQRDERFRDSDKYRELRIVLYASNADAAQGRAQGHGGGSAGVARPCNLSFIGWHAEGDSAVTWSRSDDDATRAALRIEVLGHANETPCWSKINFGSFKDERTGLKHMDGEIMRSDGAVRIPLMPSVERVEMLGHEYVKRLQSEGYQSREAKWHYPSSSDQMVGRPPNQQQMQMQYQQGRQQQPLGVRRGMHTAGTVPISASHQQQHCIQPMIASAQQSSLQHTMSGSQNTGPAYPPPNLSSGGRSF